jgi:2-haloacid dehalogenase
MRSAIEAIAFDAYGTLFNVHPVVTLCDRRFPGNGDRLRRRWRAKQLEYSWLRSLSGRYEDSWKVTESALLSACRTLGLACPTALRVELMDAYLHLDVFHDVKPALSRLSRYKLVVLSNGSLAMLRAAVENAGLGEPLRT